MPDTILNTHPEIIEITSKEYTKSFGITRDTANRDFSRLVQLDLLEQKGSGRAIHYVLKE